MNFVGSSKQVSDSDQLILAGGGHSHALLLRRWAMHPAKRPHGLITLVSESSTALYSGKVPALLAGIDSIDDISIDLRLLAQQARVGFVQATITGLDPAGQLRLHKRPPLPFDRLSLNVGSITDQQQFEHAVAIKPLAPALTALHDQDKAVADDAEPSVFHVVGAGLAGVELALALRQRWPKRSLILHVANHSLRRSVQAALQRSDISISHLQAPDGTNTLLCTGSRAPHWLQESGLPSDSKGRVRVTHTLQVLGHPHLLAAGDCAVVDSSPRPASGVWAVRAAKPLALNLERLSQHKSPIPWYPQRRSLQLIGAPEPGRATRAWILWSSVWLGPYRWIWQWKRHLDRRFMERVRLRHAMATNTEQDLGLNPMACRGCAAKLPAAPLEKALGQSGMASLGTTPEDAQPIAMSRDGATTLSSVDGFPALLSDPWLNGRLTTLHACSDLWASGARVLSAQAIVTVPAVSREEQVALLSQTLSGVRSALEEQGAALIGGHTMESRQASEAPAALDLQLSLSVCGATPNGQPPWPKGGIQPGDYLLLSRSIGTGVLFAAAMQGLCPPEALDAAITQMNTSQHALLEQLLDLTVDQTHSIHACTDVTGFGLLGHLNEMVNASGAIRIELWLDQIPVLEGAGALFAQGITSTLSPANRRALTSLNQTVEVVSSVTGISSSLDAATEALLVDPQTCGPLLLSCNDTSARWLSQQGWMLIGQASERCIR